MFGLNAARFFFNQSFIFDLNYPSPNLNHTTSLGAFWLAYFCCLEYYNCSNISPQCLSCTSRTICGTCATLYYVELFSNITSQCTLCRNTISCCQECTNATMCTICDSPYIIQGGICAIPNCQTPQINNSSSITCTASQYVLINNTCNLCSNYVVNCVSCINNATVITCTLCVSGMFPNSTSQTCDACVSGCSVCPNASLCTTCASGFYLRADNLCHSTCLTGTFTNAATLTCVNCPIECASCQSLSHCLNCSSNYYLQSDNLCYSSCPIRYFTDPTSFGCVSCPIDCLSCNSSRHCLSCDLAKDNRIIDNLTGRCVPAAGYFENNTQVCPACPTGCSSC